MLATYIVFFDKLIHVWNFESHMQIMINSPVLPVITDKHTAGYLIVRTGAQMAITPSRNESAVISNVKMLTTIYFRAVESGNDS
jgi:hypothetical protein